MLNNQNFLNDSVFYVLQPRNNEITKQLFCLSFIPNKIYIPDRQDNLKNLNDLSGLLVSSV